MHKTNRLLQAPYQDFLIIVLCLAISLTLRIWLPFDQVFLPSGQVIFAGADAWYHLRHMDYLLQNFPHTLRLDPYALYPRGQTTILAPLYDLIVVGIALLLGGSQSTLETVAALTPAVMGALMVIPVYFIALRLFDRRCALFAASLIAIQAGSFMARTVLGFSDHHAAEILFSTLIVLFVIELSYRKLTLFSNEMIGDETVSDEAFSKKMFSDKTGSRTLSKTYLALVLALGISMGSYLLVWSGASLFFAILSIWVLTHGTVSFFHSKSRQNISLFLIPATLIALAMILPVWEILPRRWIHVFAITLLLATPIVTFANSHIAAKSSWPRITFVGLLLSQCLLGILLTARFLPNLFHSILYDLGRFSVNSSNVVAEMNPLFSMGGQVSVWPVISGFGWAFFLGLAGLIFLAYMLWKNFSSGKLLLLIWSLFIFVLSLSQNRFSYYLAINLALLSALLCSYVLSLAFAKGTETGTSQKSSLSPLFRTMSIFVIAGIAFYPTLLSSISIAKSYIGPPPHWINAMQWLRQNTPEPFNDKNSYTSGQTGRKAAYSVLSWWDYGYWIVRMGRRVPYTNPTQSNAETVARYLTETDPSSAQKMVDKMNSRYVILDDSFLLRSGKATKFPAFLKWANRDFESYIQTYYIREANGQIRQLYAYKPAYYQSMAVRLFQFSGQEVVPDNSTWVLQYQWIKDKSGKQHKLLTNKRNFKEYEVARAYINSNPGKLLDLVGLTPEQSCVPLQSLSTYREIFRSGLKPVDDKIGTANSVMLRVFLLEENPSNQSY